MEVIVMEVGTFYVLYNTEAQAFIQDSQIGYTKDVLAADHYSSQEEAEKSKSYYDDEWKKLLQVIKVTLTASEV